MDLATLALAVDSSQLSHVEAELKRFGTTAKETAADTDAYNEAAAKGTTATGKFSASVKDALNPMGIFKGLLVGMAAGFSVSALASMADTWSDVSARIGVAIGDMDAAAGVMDRLTHTAQITYSSLNQTAEGFVRNSTVLQALGKSTEEQIAYTEALNLALVASGTKGQQALSVQEALSKGMTQGKLATEQLQTVLNSSSEVTKALAAELGTSVLGLQSFATQGKITGDVIFNALTKRLDEFTNKAAEMPTTIGDGFLLIGNALTALIGTFDQWAGASSAIGNALGQIANALMWVANNGETVTQVLWTMLPAMTAVFGPMVLASVQAMALAIGTQLLGAVKLLFATISAHPLGMLATVIATVVMAMYQWRDSFPAIGAMFDWLYEKAVSVLEAIARAFEGVPFFNWVSDGAKWVLEILGDDAADKIEKAHINGGAAAAGKIQGAHEKGGSAAAGAIAGAGQSIAQGMIKAQQVAAENAAVKYAEMNGKNVETVVKGLKEGGDYVYDAVTGAVSMSSGAMEKSITGGGETAASSIGQSMQSAGQSAATSFEAAGYKVSNLMSLTYTQIEKMFRQQTMLNNAEHARINAEVGKMLAETEKLTAEARAIKGGRSGSSGGMSGGVTRSGSSGGGGSVPYNPNAWNPDPLHLRLGQSGAANQNQQPAPVVNTKTEIKNVLDPNSLVDAIDTAAGHQQIINTIKHNREELRSILGTA